MAKDYYRVLGVPRNASKEEIKKAYRKLAHQYHPDKGGDEARFKEVNEAYQVLSNDQKRSQYDQFGRVFEGGQGPGFGQGGFGFEWPGGIRFEGGAGGNQEFDFSDIFEDFFGGGGGTRTRSRERRGRDVKIELSIPFEESIFGGKNEVELSKLSRCARCGGSGGEPGVKMETCKACDGKGNIQKTQRTFLGSFTQVAACAECQGSGKRPERKCHECYGKGVLNAVERIEVFIPKGIKEGEILKITGKGEASVSGGIPGDLYIQIRVRPHEHFRRQEDDVVMELPIKLSQAVLGDSVDVETLDGGIKLKIPEGTQSGDVLKVRGKGAPSSSGYGRGDLLIQIKVDIPRGISKKTKELIQELKKEGL
ncbi:MAG: molecular chaperone DnaJ [Candidatus Sungbacteria bacterium RIFCSPHIGHO2_01_FULL_50_25]|uniref:Chaperone protein DnaJ n=1 Tax=Candidatus Sungbacteria bacterium RIFCSPHIGHO2_01_FULL_50_25 TaxID=1802265 RepID=A0A1G2KB97_9BACT|nr:MAG: molecular chaperone DnaJ [Candidatus Sungbacteria bacterium RIFCSPHIGHO2_01_FULL_50_25]